MSKKYFTFNQINYMVERDGLVWWVKNLQTGRLVTTKEFDAKGFYDVAINAQDKIDSLSAGELGWQTVATGIDGGDAE